MLPEMTVFIFDDSGNVSSQDNLEKALAFIFSWIILLAIGVIVSGKLISQKLKLEIGNQDFLRIPVVGVLTLKATGAEVVFGFTLYLICVLLLVTCPQIPHA